MGSNVLPGRRDGAIIALIHLFGLSYFTFFLSYFLLRHFPKTPEAIGTAQGVVFYGGGVILWCLSSLAYRTLWSFRGEQAAPWQRLELAGALALIYTSAIPFAILHFSGHIHFRVIYLSCLTMVAVEKMAQVLTTDQINLDRDRVFRYHCVSMGLLALVPAVHGLCQMPNRPPEQAISLIRFAGLNSLAALSHLVRLPERSGLVGNWRPSLYTIHLILILNSIWYSKEVLDFSV